MRSAETLTQSTAPSRRPRQAPGRPLLIASDGSAEGGPALVIAKLLADRSGARVEVLSVLEPVNIIAPSPRIVPPPLHPGSSRVAERRARLREVSKRALGDRPEWPTEILLGNIVRSIARVARERDAWLVVTGLVHHGRIERTMRRETPLGVIRSVGVPVLAVPPSMTRLPRCVVVAVGKGDAVALLGTIAQPLLSDAVVIHLVHVKPHEPILYERESREDDDDYEEAMQQVFAEIRLSPDLPADVPIESHILVGRSTKELLDFAETSGADLLVVGFSPRSLLQHVSAGRMATRLFRGASCAVLLVPAKQRGQLHASGTTAVSTEQREWPELLSGFAKRNAGRSASLEVNDEGLGAQVLVREFHLMGIDLDPRTGTLVIMLGDAVSSTSHITHSVARPTVIAVHRRAQGSDDALGIEYDGGQLLLTLR